MLKVNKVLNSIISILLRFEGVGTKETIKIDPVLKKTLSRNEHSMIVLFAAANGDLLTLRR